MTDERLPSSAGIAPANASMLSSFLDEHADAPGYDLIYADDGDEYTRLLWSVSLVERTLERPAAAPAVRCTPIAPGIDGFSVRVDAIEMLTVVEPPPKLYTAAAETANEEAVAVRRLAHANPDAVHVPSVLALLDRADESPLRRRNALRALRSIAAERPSDCTPAVPLLRSALESDDGTLTGSSTDDGDSTVDALATLRAIGNDDPADIAPLTDDIVPFLRSDTAAVSREAARCVASIADADPDDAVDSVPALAAFVDEGADGQAHAVFALSCVTRDRPEAVEPVVETLREAIVDEALSDVVRSNATAALGRVVGERPSVAVDIVDDVATLFDADDHRLRNNAIGLIGDAATVHTDVVEPHADRIVELSTVEDTYTRINASAALARIAEDFPKSVADATGTVAELLSDDDPTVRENACWTLGHLRADEARSALEERMRDDEEASVRIRAEWALSRLRRSR